MSGTTDNLGIAEVATNQTSKELIISTALNDLDDATQREYALTFIANALTLTGTVFNRNFCFKGGDVGGNLTATGTLTVPANNREFAVWNDGSVQAIVVTAGGSVNATVTAGTLNNIFSDGTHVVANSVAAVGSEWNAGTVNSVSSNFTVISNVLSLAATLDLTGLAEVKVPAPVNASDAVTKRYADTAIQGLSIKPTAVVASITTLPAYTYANGTAGVGATLTATATGTLTIDGYLTALGDVVLVKNETTTNQPNNGLYTVTTAGAVGVAYVLTRSIDMDASAEFTGALIAIGEVSVTYPGTLWLCNQTAPTVGTTNIGFTEVSAVAASQWNAGTVGAISSNFAISGTTLALAATLDLTGLTEVKVPTTTNSTDAAQKAYVDNAAGVGLILAGYLSGCTLSWASNTTFSVATGQCMSDDDTTMMTLGSALTKTTASWVAGTSAGGLDTGTIANASWYHVFVIYNPTSKVTDVLFSLSATAPTLPSGYTKQRRIGSLNTDGSAHFSAFTQVGDYFYWAAPVNNLNNATVGNTTANTLAVQVPIGVVVTALLAVYIQAASSSAVYYSALASTDQAVSGGTGALTLVGNTFGSGQIQVLTNTSQQIRYRNQVSTDINNVVALGWIDRRGAGSTGGGNAWSAAAVTTVGNGLSINSGTIQSAGTLSYSPTVAGTITITPTSGIDDVVVTMPAAGAAMVFAVAPGYAYQDWRLHIKQGATVSTLTLNTGFIYAASGGPTAFTLTATANARDILWQQSPDGTHAVTGAVLQGITI